MIPHYSTARSVGINLNPLPSTPTPQPRDHPAPLNNPELPIFCLSSAKQISSDGHRISSQFQPTQKLIRMTMQKKSVMRMRRNHGAGRSGR